MNNNVNTSQNELNNSTVNLQLNKLLENNNKNIQINEEYWDKIFEELKITNSVLIRSFNII